MPQPRKISIDQQIEEVEYELAQRAKVYPGIARSHPRRKSELDYHVARMDAVLRTLEWVRQHRTALVSGKPPDEDQTPYTASS